MAGLDLGGLEIDLDDPLFCKEKNSEAIDEDIEILFWQGPQVDEEEEEHLEDDVVDANPENIQLCMPSSFAGLNLKKAGLHHLVDEEIQLRVGQANVCLEKLRNDLREKSILYRINRRSSTSN